MRRAPFWADVTTCARPILGSLASVLSWGAAGTLLSGGTGTVHLVSGWQCGIRDYDPTSDGDEEEWATAVAAEGWRTWHPTGVWVTIAGRRTGKWALRRPCSRPFSVHDHDSACCRGVAPPLAAAAPRKG